MSVVRIAFVILTLVLSVAALPHPALELTRRPGARAWTKAAFVAMKRRAPSHPLRK